MSGCVPKHAGLERGVAEQNARAAVEGRAVWSRTGCGARFALRADMRSGRWAVFLAALAASAPACESGFSNDAGANGAFVPSGSSGASSAAAGSNGGPLVTPPEKEGDPSYRAPVVSGRWVWTANPDTGKVAVVDAKTFTVRLADAGVGP